MRKFSALGAVAPVPIPGRPLRNLILIPALKHFELAHPLALTPPRQARTE